MYSYQRSSPVGKRRVPRVILLLFLIIVVSVLGVTVTRGTNDTLISPIPETQEPPKSPFTQLFVRSKNPEDLRRTVKETVGTTWVNYSVYVVDLDSDFSMGINDQVIYTGASVNKMPILAALYYVTQNGEVDLDTKITLQERDIQDYGTGSLRYDSPGTTYSVKTLAQLMIQKSDNTAAFILGNHVVGLKRVQELVNNWGLTQTDMVNNKTSNKDMATLFEKIYDEKVANTAYTQEILSFLKNTDFEDRIPALLPKDATVYHKIGTEVGLIHDAGIVVTPKSTYYIGIFTNDITDETETIETMARVSKVVYDFME